MNVGASWPDLDQAGLRVRQMQRKLHQWATEDSGHRFDDLFNLVHDPAFLVVAWDRVRVTPRSIGPTAGRFLGELREEVKARRFTPVPVREKMIPKANGKLRRLGIPTVAVRVVQAALKLVLEPIFEAVTDNRLLTRR